MISNNGLPSTMPTSQLLLKSLFDRGCKIQPDNLIIEKTDTGYSTQTYTQHLQQSKALALALTETNLGSPRIKRGDRVATFSFNTNRHFVCYHTIPLIGAVLHPINIRLGPKEIGYILRHAKDCVVIVDATLLENFCKVSEADLNEHIRLIIVCGENDQPHGWEHTNSGKILFNKFKNVVDWDDFLKRSNIKDIESYDWPEDIAEHSACGMCYTSGTTGNPKGVLYSHRSTYLHTLAMPCKDNHNLGGADVLLPVVPYFHANGWGIPYVALMLGARLLHNSKFTDSDTILKMAVDHGATYSAAVPAIWQSARQKLEENFLKYKNHFKIENIICGGSAPPPEMMNWYKKEFNVDFMQGWGMTETSPMGTFAKFITRFEHKAMKVEEQFSNILVAGLGCPGVEYVMCHFF